MREVSIYLAIAGASLAFLGWTISVSLEQAEETKAEFVAACEAVQGTAVWNRKHWECLK